MANFYPVGSDNLDGSPDMIQGPLFLTGPTVTSVSHGIYQINYSLDQSSSVSDAWTVIVSTGSAAPSHTQIVAGQNAAGAAAQASGTDSYGSGNDLYDISGGTMVPGTIYDVYTTATTDAGGEGSVYKTTLQLKDSVAPQFVDAVGDPLSPGVYEGVTPTSTTGAYSFRLDENASYQVAVLLTSANAPSPEDIFSGSVANNVYSHPGAKSHGAGIEQSTGLSGMTPATVYNVYVAVKDVSGNHNINNPPYQLTTLAGAPIFIGPNFSDIHLSVGVAYSIDTSTHFTGAATYSTTAPIGDGMSFNVNTGIYSGTPTATFSSNSVTFRAVNSEGTTSSNSFTVDSVNVAPQFSPIPQFSNYLETGVTISFTSTKSGTYYLVAVPFGDTAPSVQNVKDGNKFGGTAADSPSSGAMTAGVNIDVVLTGYTAADQRNVYIVLDDGTNTTLGGAYSFTTSGQSDNTAPTISNSSASLQTTSQGQINFSTSENGTYRIILIASTTTPTADQVFAGQDSTGSSANVLFVSPIGIASSVGIQSYLFTGLDHSTTYRAHIAVSDATGNRYVRPTPVVLTTLVPSDSTAPVFTVNPVIISKTQSILTGNFKINEQGSYAAVAVPQGNPAPTAENVFSGVGNNGSSVSSAMTQTGINNVNAYWQFGLGSLDAGTIYDIYVAIQDVYDNKAAVYKLTDTTNAASAVAPTYLGGWGPKAGILGQTITPINIAAFFTGVDNTYTMETGTLPDGISLSSSGVFTGTYTKVQSAGSLRVSANNASGTPAYTIYFNWTVTSPTGGAKFTGVLRSWDTNVVYSNSIGVKMYVSETFGSPPINSTVAIFNTNALGEFDVTINEAIAGTEYYVLKESPDGTITSLQKDVAETL